MHKIHALATIVALSSQLPDSLTLYVAITAGIAFSVAEPHLLVGAGAVTRCGSSSYNGIQHG
jgi:hypothetical protein